MKKTIIAGAAALSMAALPMAGVFALGTTVKDEVILTVGTGCMMGSTDNGNAGANAYNLGAVAGGASASLGEIKGTEMFVSCNTAGGWELSASATALTSSSSSIDFGALSTSGDSVWSVRLEGSNGISESRDWGTITTNAISSTAEVSGGKITPYYAAFVKDGTAAGTYRGTITYTFTAN